MFSLAASFCRLVAIAAPLGACRALSESPYPRSPGALRRRPLPPGRNVPACGFACNCETVARYGGLRCPRGQEASAARKSSAAKTRKLVESRISQKVAVSVVFVAAMFMSIMDATIVNVALPTIGRDFSVSPTDVSSISIAFLVSLAVFIPASGWLGDRFGGKRVLLAAIVVFTAASALCGLASSLGELVVFRVLQGAGGGMLAPVGMAMLFRVFPPEERIRASAILTVPTTLAPALGPVLGGLLVTDLSWRWVFYVNLPIGAAALLFGLLFLRSVPHAEPGRC